MRTLLLYITLSTSPLVIATELSTGQFSALEKATVSSSEKIRNHIIAVGRMSRTLVQPAVALDIDGHLLTAFMPTIDGEPLPYLAYLDDTKRVELVTVWEDAQAGLAILKIAALPEGITPAPISTPDSLKTSSWLIGASFPPTVLPDDVPQLILGTLQTAPPVDNTGFLVDFNQRTAGSPLFDLAGRLCGFIIHQTSELTSLEAQSIQQLAANHEKLNPLVGDAANTNLPTLPYFIPETAVEEETEEDVAFDDGPATPPSNPAHDALQTRATAAVANIPVVSIFNNAGIVTTGIQGVIIDSDGLILTKASEIGASPICQIGNQSFPAVLVATDKKTDLALLSIDATNLPTVTWNTDPPKFGQIIHIPLNLAAPPFELPTASGILSHILPAHRANAVSIHSPESITSLGIVPEQAKTNIIIGGIISESAAAHANLQRGDQILTVDGKQIPNRKTLVEQLATNQVGDQVDVEIKRNDETITATLTLDAVNFRQPMTNALVQSSRAISITPPSIRRSGFPATLVHDAPLEHFQNGSPLVDSNGAVIGINIASVTLGRTLALPSKTVLAAIARMKANSIIF